MGGELFSLFAKLTLDTSEFDKKTDGAKEKASVFGDVLKADLVGKGISAAISGLKQLGGMVANFAKDAVNSYGEVEQLRDGIETLFGDSAQKVLADADEAFKTAGMSAADYMDTSIQSAAALINSLGGDQAKAADLMNMSITDMADNVNKMGTSMEAVQNAYRGFSRGNFTMLDNLALGFAGTKEGMEELLTKAEQIKAAHGEMADYSVDSYSDIVEAIHVVQDEMGITNTTLNEAEKTIQGSLSAMKSAWKNLVAGIADPEADLGQLVDNMVETAGTALDNIIPAVERAFTGMGKVITKVAPVLTEKIPELVISVLPALGEAGLALVEGLVQALMDSAPQLWDMGLQFLTNIAQGIGDNLPTILDTVWELLGQLYTALAEGSTQLFDVGIQFITNIVQGLMESLPTLIEQIPVIISAALSAFMQNLPKMVLMGLQLIMSIVVGILNALPDLVMQIPAIFAALWTAWNSLDWKQLGKDAIEIIKSGVEQLASTIPTKLKEIAQRAIDWFKGTSWYEAGTHVIDKIKSALQALFHDIPNKLKDIAQDAWNSFRDIDWYDLGSHVIDGIVNGLSAGVGWIKEKARSVAQDALDAAKNALKIESPSKVFRDEVGKMIDRGLAIGIEDNAEEVIRSAENLSKSLINPFEGIEAPTLEPVFNNGYMGGIAGELAVLMNEAIRANNENFAEVVYAAMTAALTEADFTVNISGRDFHRLLREAGAL